MICKLKGGCKMGHYDVQIKRPDGQRFGLCCLMTPGLSKDIWCHVRQYFF